ncbi:AAA domain-containing protein [Bradyrhizobium sp. ORS 86]|uniref:bifunctional RecB family nuclease/DEAD/DEAH box helicase n=1 Tax=Bradyrhizobium sp. ORS 86 TaxID=1685970 RepID=UPI00388F45E0
MPLVPLRVSEIGEFIRFQGCERRFKLGLNNRQVARSVPFSERLFNTLDPVLQEVGRQAEDGWETALRAEGLVDLTRSDERGPGSRAVHWAEFRASLEQLEADTPAYGREIELTGNFGPFQAVGRMDFVLVLWDRGTPRLRIVEAKASRKDRTYHRIQLALYLTMLRQIVREAPIIIAGREIGPDAVEGCVARIDEVTNEPQRLLELRALSLESELSDVGRLLADDGLLASIMRREVDALDFQLNQKCDSCVFSVHCLPESARQRRLELIGVSPAICRAIRAAGVATIDELARLALDSDVATRIKQAEGFDENLGQLVALAAARRSTLPRGEDDPDNYQVKPLPNAGTGQLPPHVMQGRRLVRVYLAVDYDYAENRIGAIAAHVTASDHEVHTPFEQDPETQRFRPATECVERRQTVPAGNGQRAQYATRALATSSRDILHFQTQPWRGDNVEDMASERQLIQQFLSDLFDAIAEVAEAEQAPVHFYVYARSEMAQLVEACTRGGSRLLHHLRELLGCREGLEQLIFSSVQTEIDTRYALGWTGRGLCVATSLGWFGERYHWTRRVAGARVDLDHVFEQDIFDFKSTLGIATDGSWARDDRSTALRHRFEIRSRFHDSLSAPYWRAVWDELPAADDPAITDARVRSSIQRYKRVTERPGLMRAYQAARVHALRWLEERIRFKNDEIVKPPLDITRLREFELGIDSTARAAIDFLLLDHHVRMAEWITIHIQPPAARVQSGGTIPVRSVRADSDRELTALFDVGPFGLTAEELSLRSSVDEGSFVRLSPRAGDPNRGQTIRQLLQGGITCTITSVDWVHGRVTLSPMAQQASTYILASWKPNANAAVFDFATIDESPSDFVAGRVEQRLRSGRGRHVYDWFEPETPRIPDQPPLPPARADRVRRAVSEWEAPHGRLRARLTDDQRDAVLEGLATRVQLLKGPPGTGKTVTTATSVLARAAAGLRTGSIVLLAAHTHRAVDTLIERLQRFSDSFQREARRQGLDPGPIIVTKVHSSDPPPDANGIQNFAARPSATRVNGWLGQGILVIGGTTSALLKMAEELSQRRPFSQGAVGFQADVLVVDEASMMLFPHFLALASLVRPTGQIMLAGDNRQLAPISAHDWEQEDRPPMQHYQPFNSAYDAVLRIITEGGVTELAARQSALTFTFRLPPLIRELIARVYDLDQIELQGSDIAPQPAPRRVRNEDGWARVWSDPAGLVLIVHAERGSRHSNAVEGEIIREIVAAAPARQDADSIAVITPHRAQRALLRTALDAQGLNVSVIDTVERLQGGEKPAIIVSGTESDPHSIGAAASFILNLNRANVAFSRTQERLIVVCADTLLDHIPPELEDYESAMLWKSLRNLCSRIVFRAEIQDYSVRALAPPIRQAT